MGRTRTEPKINRATFIFNGNKTAFDTFMEAVIHDYLNSSEMPQNERKEFIGKVEISEEKEKPLDF